MQGIITITQEGATHEVEEDLRTVPTSLSRLCFGIASNTSSNSKSNRKIIPRVMIKDTTDSAENSGCRACWIETKAPRQCSLRHTQTHIDRNHQR